MVRDNWGWLVGDVLNYLKTNLYVFLCHPLNGRSVLHPYQLLKEVNVRCDFEVTAVYRSYVLGIKRAQKLENVWFLNPLLIAFKI